MRGRLQHKILVAFLTVILLTLATTVAGGTSGEVTKKGPPTLTDQVMMKTIKDLMELGESPTPNKVIRNAKDKIDSWNYYFEQAALKGLMDGHDLVHQKQKSVRMLQEIDRRGVIARRLNRPSSAKKFYRFITSPIRGPVKIAGKIREGIEQLLPPVVRPVFRVMAGKYMLGKYRTFLKAFAAKHATPELIRALDIWKTVLVVQENPKIVSKLLRGRLDEIGKNEIGQIIAKVTESALGKLPNDDIGNMMRQLLVMKAVELKKRMDQSWTKRVNREFDKNDQRLQKKIMELTRDVVSIVPNKKLKTDLDEAAHEFDQYIINTVAGIKEDKEKDKIKPDKIIAAFQATPTSGIEPLTVEFDASASEGTIEKYEWFFADGSKDGTGKSVQHTFQAPSEKEQTYEVMLTVYGPDGSKKTAEKKIMVSQDTKLNFEMREITVTPNEVKKGESIKIEGAANIQGCSTGKAIYKFYIDGKVIDSKSRDEEDLDYDLGYATNYTIPTGMNAGKHIADFEVGFTIGESEHAGLSGKTLTKKKGSSFLVKGETDEDKIISSGKCPIPKGAKYHQTDEGSYQGWYYMLDNVKVGPYVWWDPNDHSIIYMRACLDKDGKQHGVREEWYGKNQPKEYAEYLNGYLNGKKIEWNEDGEKEKEAEYKDGELNGKVSYYESGEISSMVHHKGEVLDGPYEYYEIDENNNAHLTEDGIYEYGKKVLKKTYHKNGELSRQYTTQYSGDHTKSNKKTFNENGILISEENHLDGKKHGVFMERYDDGTVSTCTYNMGNMIECTETQSK